MALISLPRLSYKKQRSSTVSMIPILDALINYCGAWTLNFPKAEDFNLNIADKSSFEKFKKPENLKKLAVAMSSDTLSMRYYYINFLSSKKALATSKTRDKLYEDLAVAVENCEEFEWFMETIEASALDLIVGKFKYLEKLKNDNQNIKLTDYLIDEPEHLFLNSNCDGYIPLFRTLGKFIYNSLFPYSPNSNRWSLASSHSVREATAARINRRSLSVSASVNENIQNYDNECISDLYDYMEYIYNDFKKQKSLPSFKDMQADIDIIAQALKDSKSKNTTDKLDLKNNAKILQKNNEIVGKMLDVLYEFDKKVVKRFKKILQPNSKGYKLAQEFEKKVELNDSFIINLMNQGKDKALETFANYFKEFHSVIRTLLIKTPGKNFDINSDIKQYDYLNKIGLRPDYNFLLYKHEALKREEEQSRHTPKAPEYLKMNREIRLLREKEQKLLRYVTTKAEEMEKVYREVLSGKTTKLFSEWKIPSSSKLSLKSIKQAGSKFINKIISKTSNKYKL